MSLSPQVVRRLLKEIRCLQVAPLDGIRVESDDCDLLAFKGWIQGPDGTPYEGGSFLVTFEFTYEYPALPPICRMVTKIFHPNISSTGEICVSALKKDWQSTSSIAHILSVIKCLLISPNPDSALNADAGRLLQESYETYVATAKLWTGVHAHQTESSSPSKIETRSSVDLSPFSSKPSFESFSGPGSGVVTDNVPIATQKKVTKPRRGIRRL